MKKKNYTTLKDIAEALNLSTTTISLVLANKPNNTSEVTKQKILNYARDVNYQKNLIASSLASKKTKIIGLLVTDLENPFLAQLSQNLMKDLEENGYTLITFSTFGDLDIEIKYMTKLLSLSADLTLVTTNNGEEMEKWINNNFNKPVIFIDRFDNEDNSFCSIEVDNFNGGYIAGKYLLDKNHTNIACVTGNKNLRMSRKRLEGFKEALLEKNCEVKYVYFKDFEFSDGFYIGEEIISSKVTAVFFMNDWMSLGFIDYCNRKNIKIPEDISIMGFDNIIYSQYTFPSLTTIKQPIDEICQKTIEMIKEIEINSEYKKRVLIQPSIIERESVKEL